MFFTQHRLNRPASANTTHHSAPAKRRATANTTQHSPLTTLSKRNPN
ncbi:hypothetical protein [Anabaena sp. CCY 9402-a]